MPESLRYILEVAPDVTLFVTVSSAHIRARVFDCVSGFQTFFLINSACPENEIA